MPEDNTAPRARNRLTKKPPEASSAARALVDADMVLSGARPARAELASILQRLADEIRRLWDYYFRSAPMPTDAYAPVAAPSSTDSLGQAPYAPGGMASAPAQYAQPQYAPGWGGPGGEVPAQAQYAPAQPAADQYAPGWEVPAQAQNAQAPYAQGRGAPGWGGPAAAPPMMSDGPRQPSFSEAPVRQEMAQVEALIDRLLPDARMAFEDAVLKLVRSDDDASRVFETAPHTIPTIAKYAINAHYREVAPQEDVTRATTAEAAMNAARDTTIAHDAQQFDELRNRWERPAPQGSGQDFSGADRHATEVAEQSQWESGHVGLALSQGLEHDRARQEGLTSSSMPGPNDLTDGLTFLAAENGSPAEPDDRSQGPAESATSAPLRPSSPWPANWPLPDNAAESISSDEGWEWRPSQGSGPDPGVDPYASEVAERSHVVQHEGLTSSSMPGPNDLTDGLTFLAAENGSPAEPDNRRQGPAEIPRPVSAMSPSDLLPSRMPADGPSNDVRPLIGLTGRNVLQEQMAASPPNRGATNAGSPSRPAAHAQGLGGPSGRKARAK